MGMIQSLINISQPKSFHNKVQTGSLPISLQSQTEKFSKGNSQFDNDWLKADATVLALGFLGWTVPSSIPVSGFGGASLFSKFIGSIGSELAHFPSELGPSLDSDFWLYLILYHIGLFLCLLLGQIG